MINHTCTIDGCEQPTRSTGSEWCKMHYHRWYRHGDPLKVATTKSTRSDDSKYRSLSRVDHPLAMASGRVYEHRMVLFDAIGPGTHACHWCGKGVDWSSGKGDPHQLQVDHLNTRRDDNRLENLVVSCPDCNVGRGAQGRHDALKSLGFWSRNDTIAGLKKHGRRPRVDAA